MNLGTLLKKIRSEKSMTLAEVADAVDLTSSSLSQIENEKIFPSILTLQAILQHYRVPMSEFFRQMEQSDLIVVPKDSLETVQLQDGIYVSLLASKLRDNSIESYEMTLDARCAIAVKELPSYINGERFVIVRTGSIIAEMANHSISLHEGDSFNFKSDLSCTIKNVSASPAVVFINGTPPVL